MRSCALGYEKSAVCFRKVLRRGPQLPLACGGIVVAVEGHQGDTPASTVLDINIPCIDPNVAKP
jgi:hypothetical protein